MTETVSPPSIDLFKGIKQEIETLELERLLSRINPRQEESYAPVKMAGDIAECGFRILNKPIVAFPEEGYRKELSMSELERLILQGHRRIRGWAYLGEHFADFGLTAEQAKMFRTITVETLYGLTKAQCLEFALDEKYKVNLKSWEVATLLRDRIAEMGAAQVNVTEMTLNYAKLILESRMIASGPGKLPRILDISNRRIQNEEFVKAARNGTNHMLYASKLGPWFADQTVLFYKYVRDGVVEPNDSKRVIDCKWELVTDWHKNYVNDKETIWNPVMDVVIEGDAKAPKVTKVIGGDREGKCIEWIGRAVKNAALGDKPSKRVSISKATKEKLDKNMDSSIGQTFCQLLKGEDVLPLLVQQNDEYKQTMEQIEILKRNFDKLPNARKPLAKTFIERVSGEAFRKAWLK